VRKQISHDLFLQLYQSSKEDRLRAAEIPPHHCPRRYCEWWRTDAFDWEVPIADGCRSSEAAKLPGYQDAEIPCRRVAPDTGVDHYEPRDPSLTADAFATDRFCKPHFPGV